jgi:hypothetical protein
MSGNVGLVVVSLCNIQMPPKNLGVVKFQPRKGFMQALGDRRNLQEHGKFDTAFWQGFFDPIINSIAEDENPCELLEEFYQRGIDVFADLAMRKIVFETTSIPFAASIDNTQTFLNDEWESAKKKANTAVVRLANLRNPAIRAVVGVKLGAKKAKPELEVAQDNEKEAQKLEQQLKKKSKKDAIQQKAVAAAAAAPAASKGPKIRMLGGGESYGKKVEESSSEEENDEEESEEEEESTKKEKKSKKTSKK